MPITTAALGGNEWNVKPDLIARSLPRNAAGDIVFSGEVIKGVKYDQVITLPVNHVICVNSQDKQLYITQLILENADDTIIIPLA